MNRVGVRVLGAVVAALAIPALVIGVAWVSLPDDPWVQVDRVLPIGDLVELEVTADEPQRTALYVPKTGLDRVDVRLEVPLDARDETLLFDVRDRATGRHLARTAFPMTSVSVDAPAAIQFATIAHEQSHEIVVELRAERTTTRGVMIQAYRGESIQSASALKGGSNDPSGFDWDLVTYTNVPDKLERFRLIAHRLDALRSPLMGSVAVIVGLVLALIGLYVISFLLVRDAFPASRIASVDPVPEPEPTNVRRPLERNSS